MAENDFGILDVFFTYSKNNCPRLKMILTHWSCFTVELRRTSQIYCIEALFLLLLLFLKLHGHVTEKQQFD
jgi:hypothetical protein